MNRLDTRRSDTDRLNADRANTGLRDQLQGLWLPLVTPFRNGEIDEASLRRLVEHYARGPVDGLILAATSGEGMTLEMAELERIVALTRAAIAEPGALCRSASGYRAPVPRSCRIRWMKRRPGRSTAI